jgi:hypothetical protein
MCQQSQQEKAHENNAQSLDFGKILRETFNVFHTKIIQMNTGIDTYNQIILEQNDRCLH